MTIIKFPDRSQRVQPVCDVARQEFELKQQAEVIRQQALEIRKRREDAQRTGDRR